MSTRLYLANRPNKFGVDSNIQRLTEAHVLLSVTTGYTVPTILVPNKHNGVPCSVARIWW